MNLRDFKKVYDRHTGRKRWRHYSGGPFFDTLKSIDPNNYIGKVGLGMRPNVKQQIITTTKTAEEEAQHIGNEILHRLRIRNGSGVKETGTESISQIQERIRGLISGGALIIN